MPTVLIACPITGNLVYTRIDAEDVDDVGEQNMLISCHECGHDHEWTPSEAVLASA